MSEYTPTTEHVRDLALRLMNAAEFDRWLAGVKADARREGQAEAWDEGRQAGVDDMIAAEVGSFRRRKPNPHRTTKEN